MSSQPKFIDLCLAGDAASEAIDDFVDQWHADPAGSQLDEFLGMTKEEYSLWVRVPDALKYILKARRDRTPLPTAIDDFCRRLRRAGKAADQPTLARLEAWLRAQGQLA